MYPPHRWLVSLRVVPDRLPLSSAHRHARSRWRKLEMDERNTTWTTIPTYAGLDHLAFASNEGVATIGAGEGMAVSSDGGHTWTNYPGGAAAVGFRGTTPYAVAGQYFYYYGYPVPPPTPTSPPATDTPILPTNSVRVVQPRASHVKTAYYTLTLPAGWISSRLSRSQSALISRDQLVEVQLRTSATRGRPSTAGLRRGISRLAGALGGVKSLTFSTVTVGRLRGISGMATYARKPYRLVVVALPDQSGRRPFVLTAVVHSRATARDLRQYQALVASLQPLR